MKITDFTAASRWVSGNGQKGVEISPALATTLDDLTMTALSSDGKLFP
jgi:hypothetical protein